jgi:Putative MetA-pathway of phenol degradation
VTHCILRSAIAAVIACVVGSAAAHAQALSGISMSRTAGNGPPTLVDLILGPGASRTGEPVERDRIDPDRPHLPDASTTVGLGHVVIESGYTYTKNDTRITQTYPETLLRVGMFAEWFELRVGQSFLDQRQSAAGMQTSSRGAQDLYFGAKLAVARQDGLLPAIAVIPQVTVPTGSTEVTAGRVLPGVNLDFNWEIVKDRFGIELLLADNQVRDDVSGTHNEFATGLTGVLQLTKNLEGFVEWDAYVPTGAHDAARHYAVGGLVYFVTPDLAVDIRAGVGLNDHAEGFIAGLGFALRR